MISGFSLIPVLACLDGNGMCKHIISGVSVAAIILMILIGFSLIAFGGSLEIASVMLLVPILIVIGIFSLWCVCGALGYIFEQLDPCTRMERYREQLRRLTRAGHYQYHWENASDEQQFDYIISHWMRPQYGYHIDKHIYSDIQSLIYKFCMDPT